MDLVIKIDEDVFDYDVNFADKRWIRRITSM